MKWTELYANENDLVLDMLKTKSDIDKNFSYEVVKGYEYIESFKKYYAKHNELTVKQFVQLKRLAKAIYSNLYFNNHEFMTPKFIVSYSCKQCD